MKIYTFLSDIKDMRLLLKNRMLTDSEKEDAYVLIHGMFSTQLPPLLDDIFNKKALGSLIVEIACTPKNALFKQKDINTGLIPGLAKEVKHPAYIYGQTWASESIKFFTLKSNNSWRPMAIPNIKHALMFAYNSLIVADESLNRLYSKDERLEGKTSHSESPIIGRDGIFSSMLYDPFDKDASPDLNDLEGFSDDPIGFIGYDQLNRFFEENKLHKYRIESTYPYILQTDFNKFFENIYTHLIAQIDVNDFCLDSSRNASTKVLEQYFNWLDEFNQKINDNHTKGLIQGPISSKISAELLQLSLDQKISSALSNNKLDVGFTRYVDDYRFFGKTITDLEAVKNILITLFRNYALSFNETKLKLFKGFEIQKQAHLENYPKLFSLLRRKNPSVLNFNLYQNIHDNISLMIENLDIPTLKGTLTKLKNKIQLQKIKFDNDQIVLSFLEFLIKVAYVIPLSSTQTYKLINSIISSIKPKLRHECWKRLFSEFEYIRENFPDTDLEIWFFFVLSEFGTSREVARAVTKYLKNNDTPNPIILSVLVKSKSRLANKKIESFLLSQIDDSRSVSQSKWCLPLARLWIKSDHKVLNDHIRNLFLSPKDKIEWDKLGIIQYLQKQTQTS